MWQATKPAHRMAELIFVRHATTTWSGVRYCGRADPPLNHAGQSEAKAIAVELAAACAAGATFPGRVISSPARRARQTAAAIASAFPGLRIELDERWQETDVGIAEGLTFDELGRVQPELARRLARGDGEIDWPGGESASSLAERVESALRDVGHPSSPTIVVSHAGTLRIAVARATNVPLERVAFLRPAGVLRVANLARA
jgi:broad specificity phosphatase PhoE